MFLQLAHYSNITETRRLKRALERVPKSLKRRAEPPASTYTLVDTWLRQCHSSAPGLGGLKRPIFVRAGANRYSSKQIPVAAGMNEDVLV